MDGGTPPSCRECEGKCPHNAHTNVSYYYEAELQKTQAILEDVKKHFEEAKGRKATATDVFAQLHSELNATEARVKAMVSEIAGSLNELQAIALNTDRMSQISYIENLIEQEKHKHTRGSANTLRMLQRIHKELKSIHDIGEGTFDPFRIYRETAETIQRENPDMAELDLWIEVANRMRVNNDSECETRFQKFQNKFFSSKCAKFAKWLEPIQQLETIYGVCGTKSFLSTFDSIHAYH